MRAPKSSSESSTTSRRLTRFRTGLGALGASRVILAPCSSVLARRIRARWQRGVARALAQLALELLNARLELMDAAIHRQQHFNHGLTPRVIDRLRLSALHTPIFDKAELCPPTN